jgi:hypothetical protein
MIFGGLLGISFARPAKNRKESNAEGSEITEQKKDEPTLRDVVALAQFGDFLIEVGQRGFQGFSVVGVGCGGQIIGDAGAGHLQIVDALLPQMLLDTLLSVFCRRLAGFNGFDLRFDVLTFPASGHAYIVAQSVRTMTFLIGASFVRELRVRVSCESFGTVGYAPAARARGRIGRVECITPRIVLSATRAKCSAKIPL